MIRHHGSLYCHRSAAVLPFFSRVSIERPIGIVRVSLVLGGARQRPSSKSRQPVRRRRRRGRLPRYVPARTFFDRPLCADDRCGEGWVDESFQRNFKSIIGRLSPAAVAGLISENISEPFRNSQGDMCVRMQSWTKSNYGSKFCIFSCRITKYFQFIVFHVQFGHICY